MNEYRLAIVIDANGRPAVEAINMVTGASQKLEGAQRGAAAGADRLRQSSAGSNSELSNLGNTAKRVQGYLAAVFGAAVVREIIGTTNRIDGMRRTLEGVLGSGQAAVRGIAFVRAEADRLGVAFQPALDGYTKLAAAARGTDLAPKVNELTRAILQAGGAFNLGGDQISGAITAVEQMISKGSVSAEELRGQLGERIPGAFGIAAKSMGVTTAELSKMLEKGEVVANDFLPKFAAELQRSTAAAAKLNASSPAAELARIRNELEGIATDIGGGVFEGLGEGLEEFKDLLAGINAKDLGKDIGVAIGSIVRNIDIGVAAFAAFAGAKGIGAVVLALQGFGLVAKAVPVPIAAAAMAFRALNVPVVGSTSAITMWTRAAGVATTVGRGLLTLIGGWPGLLAAAAAGTYYLATSQTTSARAADRASEAIRNLKTATDAQRGSALAAARAELQHAEALLARSRAAADSGVLTVWGAELFTKDLVTEDVEELTQTVMNLRSEIQAASGGTAGLEKLFKTFDKASGATKLLKALGFELDEETKAVTKASVARTGSTAAVDREHAAKQRLIDIIADSNAGESQAAQLRVEYEKQQRKINDLVAKYPALAGIASQAQEALTRAYEDAVDALDPFESRLRELEDVLERGSTDKFAADMLTLQIALDEAVDAGDWERVERLTAAMEQLELQAGKAASGSDVLRDSNERMAAEAKRIAEEVQAFWGDVGDSISDSIGDAGAAALFHFDEIDDVLSDLGDSMVQTFERAVSQIISEFMRLSIINPMLNGLLGTALPTGGGMLSQMFSGQGGGMLGQLFSGQGGGVSGLLGQLGGLFGLGGGASAAGGLFGLGGSFLGAGAATSLGASNLAALGLYGPGMTTATATSGLAGLGGTVGSFTPATAAGGLVSGSGMSTAFAGVPIIGWIAAAMATNMNLFAQGWRSTGGSLTLPDGQRVRGGSGSNMLGNVLTAGGVTALDGALRGLGLSDSVASLLSGSSIHARLFGRKAPELTNSEISMSFGADGASASARYRTLERGGVFRTDRRRWHDGSSDEATEAAQALLASVRQVIVQGANQLRGEAPALLDAAIRTLNEYDSKGKIKATQIFVDILGRTWEEETQDLASARVMGENLISMIDHILGTTVATAGVAIGNTVTGAMDAAGNNVDASGVTTTFDEIIKTVGGTIGEASAIAERWRTDAETLLAGAGFLLAAATDMRNGAALIADGTLTQITDLVESLGLDGESMIETYARLQLSTQLYLGALGIMEGALQTSTAESVAFAVGVVDAMGGLDAAGQQLNVILQTFFTDAERAALRLQDAQSRAARAQTELGVEGVTFENYRSRFESAREAGLTPEEFAAWVRLGVALSESATAAAAMAVSTGAVSEEAQLYLDALGVMDGALQSSNAEILAFGDAVVVAMGGLESASQQFDVILSEFFTEAESAALRLAEAQTRATSAQADLGIEGVTADNYRARFDAARAGGLSPEEFAAWVRLGVALADASDAADELSAAADEQAAIAEAAAERMQAAADLYLDALGVMDGGLQVSSEQILAFADNAVEAMGGLDAAAQQLDTILSTFFTETERAAFRLQDAQARSSQAQADLGIEGVTADNYRARFDAARAGGLSPAEFAAWVRLGVALADASDAADVMTTAADEQAAAAEAAAERMQAAADLYLDALGVMDGGLLVSSDNIVAFADSAVEAMGGLDAAAQQLDTILSTFFTETERAAFRLQDAQARSSQAQADLGIEGVTADNYRARFDAARAGGLSPAEFAAWVRLGVALADASDAADVMTTAADEQAAAAEAAAERMQAAADLYLDALGVMDGGLLVSSDNIVAFADSAVEAMGGLDAAAQQLDTILSTFFTETERAAFRLQDAQARSSQAQADLGIEGVTADNYRARFDAARAGGLSPAEFAAWVRLGVALADASDAADVMTTAADEQAAAAEAAAERMQAAADLYLDALGVMDGGLQVSSEQILAFADNAVEAMGGLDAAAQQLDTILSTFFTETERAAFRLQDAQARASQAQSDLGIEGVTADNYRARFDAARAGGLSPAEFAAWVRLGVALADASDAADVMTTAADEQAAAAEAAAERMQAAADLFLGALGVMDGGLLVSTDNILAFADEAVEAMGGLDAAAQQLDTILSTFFTDAERAAFKLQDAQARANSAQSDLGIQGVNVDNYRARFDAARAAGLTPEEFAAWVRLGVALADGAEAANTMTAALTEFTTDLASQWSALNRDGMDAFVVGVEDVTDWIRQSTDEANRLARAAGLQAASVETLTQIQLTGAARIGQAIAALDRTTASLISSLYASDDAIAEFDLNRSNSPLAIAQQAADGFREAFAGIDPQRYQDALTVAQNLFNLGWANNDDPLNIADRMGLPFDRFIADLGIDIRDLSDAANFDGLVQAARAMGVELPQLAARLGVNLGQLADANSLLNNGFEQVLASMDAAQRAPIEALLQQLETAPAEDREALIEQLTALINALPAEWRAQFAPFLDGVDITPPEREQVLATDRVTSAVNAGNAFLERIALAVESELTTVAPTPTVGSPGTFNTAAPPVPKAELSAEQIADLKAVSRQIQAVESAMERSNELLREILNVHRTEDERRSLRGIK